MAIKRSNQITFTEQKKIKELKEWYLVTNFDTILVNETTPETATEGQLWFSRTDDNSAKLMQFTNGEWIICPSQFTTETQSVNVNNRYLWNYEEVVYSIGSSDISDPVLIGMYGTGADGKGITDIVNYYAVTQEPALPDPIPDDFWKDNMAAIQELSSVNKYLWNYEKIIYTDGLPGESGPMIIGVYGDSGEDAITFQIYSPDGFQFIDSITEEERITEIELNVAAFKGSDPLEGATFTWSYWDKTANDGAGEDKDIEGHVGVTDPSFIVKSTDEYAFSTLKCTMFYDNNQYEDYVTLTAKVDIYYASANFFNNTNVLAQTEEYIIGYVDLYKNNTLEDSKKTTNCYIGDFTVDSSTGVITTDYKADNGNICYFINTTNNNYQIILGQYNDSKWSMMDNTPKYIYQIDLNLIEDSNIFLISKKHINRSSDINIKVYTKYITDENGVKTVDSSSLVAITRTTITDLNDVIISSDDPALTSNIYEGQLWLDTTNGILKIRTNDEWIPAAKQKKGQSTYTLKPKAYEIGDLWIVAKEDEIIGFTKENGDTIDFIEGSIWVAEHPSDETGFNPEHWSDAVPEITALKNNINYYMDFVEETGLRIGQKNKKFYVNIDATRMSFCEDENITISDEEIEREFDPNEIVHIGNKSATIRNLVVEGSADINCSVSVDSKIDIINTYQETQDKYPGFTWQMEADGGFSLVKMEVK